MANGDIAITTPPTVPNLVLGDVHIVIVPSPFLTATYFETDSSANPGKAHTVRIINATNGGVTGFDLTAGVFTDNLARTGATYNNYLTTILGVLFIGDASTLNQRKTAFTTRLKTDGVITVTGTVG